STQQTTARCCLLRSAWRHCSLSARPRQCFWRDCRQSDRPLVSPSAKPVAHMYRGADNGGGGAHLSLGFNPGDRAYRLGGANTTGQSKKEGDRRENSDQNPM